MCPYLGYLVVYEQYSTAFGLFLIAGVTDLVCKLPFLQLSGPNFLVCFLQLDGWIARTFPNQSSLAGSFLDPLADKLLIGTLYISLTYSGLIPVLLTGLIISRDLLLIASAFIIRYISLQPPVTKNSRSNTMHVTFIS